MKVWKRVGLEENTRVTETIVITDKEHSRVKIYLKDYSDDMSRRPQFRGFAANSQVVPDRFIVIPYNTWFSNKKIEELLTNNSKYIDYTIYYIQRTLGRVYVVIGLIQNVETDPSMARRTVFIKQSIGRKLDRVGFAIPTDCDKWTTAIKDEAIISTPVTTAEIKPDDVRLVETNEIEVSPLTKLKRWMRRYKEKL